MFVVETYGSIGGAIWNKITITEYGKKICDFCRLDLIDGTLELIGIIQSSRGSR